MNPLFALTAFVPFFAAAFWLAAVEAVPLRAWAMGLPAGLLAWTLIEYALHRFAHDVPLSVPGGRPHLGHHQRPTDLRVMVTPLSFTLPVSAALWGLLRLVLGSWALAGVVMTGLLAGYFCYEFIHYGVHLGDRAGSALGPWRTYHFQHHFRTPQRAFGVTTPLWDWIFRTSPTPDGHP